MDNITIILESDSILNNFKDRIVYDYENKVFVLFGDGYIVNVSEKIISELSRMILSILPLESFPIPSLNNK